MIRELFRLRRYVKDHLWLFILALILGWPMAGVQLYTAKQMQMVLDDIFMNKDMDKLIQLPLILIGLWLANGFFRYFHYLCHRIGAERTVNALRKDVYSKFMDLGVEFYTKSKTGEMMARITNDIQVLFQGIGTFFDLFREPFILLALLGYAIYLNWKLTILTIIVIPIVFILIDRVGKALRRYGLRSQEVVGDMSHLMQESFSGILMIKAYDLEKFMRKRFNKLNRKSLDVATKAIRVEELSPPILDLLLVSIVAGVIFMGGKTVIEGGMTTGEFFAYLAALAMMQQPVRKLNNCSMKLNVASTAAKRISAIFEEQVSINDSSGASEITKFEEQIEFKDLHFSYADAPILKKISFNIKKGSEIALVGPSGAGKSTLLHLIPRLYELNSGQILIDGKDIKEISQKSLKSLISYVSQDVFLFHDTVRANLTLNKEYSDEQIWESLERAHAKEFVMELPEGLDTIIGERGNKLSGGQRQRLSIARAVLKDTEILLLDEATSSLDTQSERLVQAALSELMRGRTSLVIAHRLSTVVNADEILVMKEGEIVQRGTHKELNSKEGLYHNLVKMQSL